VTARDVDDRDVSPRRTVRLMLRTSVQPLLTRAAARGRDLWVRARHHHDRRAAAALSLVALVVLVAVVVAALGVRAVLKGTTAVVVAAAAPATIDNQPGGSGNIVLSPGSAEAVGVNFPYSGFQLLITVTHVDVTNGAVVAVNQPLFEVDPTSLEENAAAITSQLQDAEGALAKVRVESNASSRTVVDDELPALETSVAIDSELVSIASGSSTTITAPVAGIVDNLHIQPGQAIPIGQNVLQIVNLSTIEVAAGFQLADLQTIRPGESAVISPTNLPGVELPARVIAVEATSATDGLEGSVILRADNLRASPLPLGTQVFVQVNAPERAMVSVPNIAVLDATIAPEVLIDDNGHVRLQPVEIGATDTRHTEILSGLRDGERVVVSNMQTLTTGSAIRVLRTLG
jgi:RND family efflux transporter MFP subunit